jgi:hypothetical protein
MPDTSQIERLYYNKKSWFKLQTMIGLELIFKPFPKWV